MFRKLFSFLYTKQDVPVLDDASADKMKQLERLIGTPITDPTLFLRALRHRSKLADDNLQDYESYEQLEFLGDAVLDLIISEILFSHFPNENEGFMTKARSRLVKGSTLAKIAKDLSLDNLLVIGERAKGQGIENSVSVLSDVFEAIIGASYRTIGYEKTYKFVNRVYHQCVDIKDLAKKQDNYKSVLLEYTQSYKIGAPEYIVLKEDGPPHNRIFTIAVYIDTIEVGRGKGPNKKNAEQLAAKQALNYYNLSESSLIH